MTLCIFSIPKKPGDQEIDKIQENAIYSLVLQNNSIVVLIGEDGSELAEDFGINCINGVVTNEFGTPIVSDAFRLANYWCPQAKYFMYTNCDIVYTHDICGLVDRVAKKFKHFMIVGRRTDVPGPVPIELFDSENDVISSAIQYVEGFGKLHIWSGIDYFIIDEQTVKELSIPDFAVGRVGWDNWMIGRAKQLGITVVNATAVIPAVHQDHQYNHVDGGFDATRKGIEAQRNKKLAEGVPALTIRDADYSVYYDDSDTLMFG